MYPPKKSEPEAAVRGAVTSLMRAGLEATDLIRDHATGSWVVRLYSMPPKNGMGSLRSYLRRYLRACGYIPSIKVANCRMWISVMPRAAQSTDQGQQGNDARETPGPQSEQSQDNEATSY